MTKKQPNSKSGSYRIERRTLLALFSLGAVGCVPNTKAESGSDSSNPIDEDNHSLPRKLTRYPQPVPAEILDYRQYIPAGKTIHHTAAWRTIADEGRDKLEEFFEVTEITFIIDGEKVTPSEGSWSWEKIPRTNNERGDQAQWRRQWTYSTSPKEPGTYAFEVEINYNQPFTSKVGWGESKTRSGVRTHEGRYSVTHPSSLPTSQSIGSKSGAHYG